jgi:hypothetical protein
MIRKSVAIRDERERGRRSSIFFVVPAVHAPALVRVLPGSKSGFTARYPSFDHGIAFNLLPVRRFFHHELTQSRIAFSFAVHPLRVPALGRPGCLQLQHLLVLPQQLLLLLQQILQQLLQVRVLVLVLVLLERVLVLVLVLALADLLLVRVLVLVLVLALADLLGGQLPLGVPQRTRCAQSIRFDSVRFGQIG